MPVTPHNNRILVAMSGGVDSAVSAKLLLSQGFEVHCAVCIFSNAGVGCVAAAKSACDTLGLPLEVIDVREQFDDIVICLFCVDYCAGRTPSPCVLCNPRVKFASLLNKADELGCAYIATGHYARVEKRGGFYVLKTAVCAERDQSYMLYALGQDVLSRLIMPLGEVESKAQVRAAAAESSLASAKTPDSQEICFIPDSDYPSFIKARGFHAKSGRFISPDGEVLGEHLGVDHYTVGQRKGLGASFGEPVYVSHILENGDIQLVRAGGEYSAGCSLTDVRINPYYAADTPCELLVKVRSAASARRCVLKLNGLEASLEFDSPVRAVAPGQAAVLYEDSYVVGGGTISAVHC